MHNDFDNIILGNESFGVKKVRNKKWWQFWKPYIYENATTFCSGQLDEVVTVESLQKALNILRNTQLDFEVMKNFSRYYLCSHCERVFKSTKGLHIHQAKKHKTNNDKSACVAMARLDLNV